MKVFYTPAAQHLAPLIGRKPGAYTLAMFDDGEMFVRLDEDVRDQRVTVIAATNLPAQNFLHLFFLLDTLAQQRAKITLILTYFGYARQDHPEPNVARAALVMSNCFKQFVFERVFVVHPHSVLLKNYFNFEPIIPYQIYVPFVQQQAPHVIIAPDSGAVLFGQELARQAGIDFGFLQKEHTGSGQIHIMSVQADVAGKDVLIVDDIVSSGRTLVQAAAVLSEHGACRVSALVTHNLLNTQSVQVLSESSLKHVWVSNTLANMCVFDRVSVLDVSACVSQLLN